MSRALDLLDGVIQRFQLEYLSVYHTDTTINKTKFVISMLFSDDLSFEQKERLIETSIKDTLSFSFLYIILVILNYLKRRPYWDIEFLCACFFTFPISDKLKDSFTCLIIDLTNIRLFNFKSYTNRPPITDFKPMLFINSIEEQYTDMRDMLSSLDTSSLYICLMNLLRFSACIFRLYFIRLDSPEQKLISSQKPIKLITCPLPQTNHSIH